MTFRLVVPRGQTDGRTDEANSRFVILQARLKTLQLPS
jgi:hypothetical protein